MQKITILAVFALAVTGCATLPPGVQGYAPNSADVYSPTQAQAMQTVRLGTVLAIRPVNIEASAVQTATASGAGALLGGLLGHQVGSGNGKTAATVAGALAGAVGGNLAGNRMRRQPGLQITVQLDSREVLAVTQSADIPVRVGDRVQLIGSRYGSTPARVVPFR